jgi:lipopolysaccharide/colanic/teichoic acid biosynthesis glycosyltransferase
MSNFTMIGSLQNTNNKSFIHTLTSKTVTKDRVLIVTGYDYFLQRNDLKNLLQTYRQIILVPRSVNDNFFLGETVGRIITQYSNIHLVNNPVYDEQNQVVYQVILKNSKTLTTKTVSDFCEYTLKKIYVPESIEDVQDIELGLEYFSVGVRIVKKAMDWGAGSLILLATLPVWILAYFRIKAQSPGPVFYRQKRVGIKEGEFECIKFRSMRLDAETNGAQFSSKNDDRIFDFGKTMRATRVDELPQLLNIVKGEMSLVGPRPERRVFTETFEELIPHYAQRHVVKPGITGYAQVMYPYGAGVKDARHKLMYDLYYIKNWSISLKIKIVLMTAGTVLFKKGM